MTINLSELNKEQLRAVTYTSGPLLVLAGAGSGKTKCLTYRVAFFISKLKVLPENVLLTTFTNKAAKEMKERMNVLLNEAGLPTDSVQSLQAGTFHSFCAKVLRIDGEEIGIFPNFLIYDESDQKDLVKEIINELGLKESTKPSSILYAISEAKNQMLNPDAYFEIARGDIAQTVFQVYKLYEKRLK